MGIGEKGIMSLAFVIEIDSHAVGLVVRDGALYRFHASVGALSCLEGQSFRSPQDAERAIRQEPCGKDAGRSRRELNAGNEPGEWRSGPRGC